MTGPASEATAYPVLDASQQARLRRYGTTRRVTAGEILYSPADDSCDLLVVLSGEVVVSNDALGRSVELARHGPGQFAGELNMLTGQRPFLTARAITEGLVLALTPAQVHEVLARETDVADILLRVLIARRRRHVSGAIPGAAIEIIGTSQSGPALALRTFLNRNTIAYQWVDVDLADRAAGILGSVGATSDDLPVVITPTRVLRNADPAGLAAALGLGRYPGHGRPYDVVVVGAGPAGLAAAVYGASEGLDVAVLDATAPGGQAGSSSRIENYLGFPDGISGAELTTRATIQAQRFGALLASPCRVDRLAVAAGGSFTVRPGRRHLGRRADGGSRERRAGTAACRYRTGSGWRGRESTTLRPSWRPACPAPARCSCSAAAIRPGRRRSTSPAGTARHDRGPPRDSLAASMSRSLIDRIEGQRPDRRGHFGQVVARSTAAITWSRSCSRHLAAGAARRFGSRGLFCFIGARPLAAGCRRRSRRRRRIRADRRRRPGRPGRAPPRLPFETTLDGLFAAGDIRVGSMKRFAARRRGLVRHPLRPPVPHKSPGCGIPGWRPGWDSGRERFYRGHIPDAQAGPGPSGVSWRGQPGRLVGGDRAVPAGYST